jgi:hypothetical protein
MADQEPLNTQKVQPILSVIPEVYYDLIGRVPAGIMTVLGGLWIVSSSHPLGDRGLASLESLDWAPAMVLLALLTMSGYTVGLVLNVGGWAVYRTYRRRLFMRVMKAHRAHFAPLVRRANQQLALHLVEDDSRWSDSDVTTLSYAQLDWLDRSINDHLKRADRHARVILPKLGAEAMLCNNLVAGIVVLAVTNAIWSFPELGVSTRGAVLAVGVVCLTIAAAWHRNQQLLKRQFSLLNDVFGTHSDTVAR